MRCWHCGSDAKRTSLWGQIINFPRGVVCCWAAL